MSRLIPSQLLFNMLKQLKSKLRSLCSWVPTKSSDWCDLPQDLVWKISQHLDTPLDFLRFRAICHQWRLFSPPPPSLPPLQLPYPITPDKYQPPSNTHTHFHLTQSIVYLIHPQHPQHRSGPETNVWLAKLARNEDGFNTFRVLSPVSDLQIKKLNLGQEVGNGLNLLNYRFTEVCKVCHLSKVGATQKDIAFDRPYEPKKVLFFPGPEPEVYTVVALDRWGGLYYVKNGFETWVRCSKIHFLDMIDYRGRLHAVDKSGNTFVFDSAFLEPTMISDCANSWGSRKVLVENSGTLMVVDVLLDTDISTYRNKRDGNFYPTGEGFGTAVRMKVFSFVEEECEWREVKNLKSYVLFLGEDCSFFILERDLGGLKGNRVYFADESIKLEFKEEKKLITEPKKCYHYTYSYDGYAATTAAASTADTGGHFGYYNDEGGSCDGYNFDHVVLHAYSHIKGESDDVLKGLKGHNIGVLKYGTNEVGSLLMYREFADIFWPPPSWIKLD